jgi:hypothetical protein
MIVDEAFPDLPGFEGVVGGQHGVDVVTDTVQDGGWSDDWFGADRADLDDIRLTSMAQDSRCPVQTKLTSRTGLSWVPPLSGYPPSNSEAGS